MLQLMKHKRNIDVNRDLFKILSPIDQEPYIYYVQQGWKLTKFAEGHLGPQPKFPGGPSHFQGARRKFLKALSNM